MKVKQFNTPAWVTLFFWSFTAIMACKQPQIVANQTAAWYKNQLIYNLDVKVFKDSNHDGYGDFNGLNSKLDYLQGLGVNTIWLAPFQPSPGNDDGYDVADFYGIDKRLGDKKDVTAFLTAAHAKHIKVIMDVVLNHTSIEHPWFKTSAQDSSSAKHDWYLWSTKRPADWDKGMGFPEVENATWTYSKSAKAYYFHRFYKFQPDLNFQNTQVLKEAEHILKYWLDLGMDGFRVDAVPFIIDDPRNSSEKPSHDFKVLHQLAAFVKEQNPNALLLGEANVKPDEIQDYFSKNNNGLDMMFNFEVNEYLFYALATGKANLLKDALKATTQKPPATQWAHFLRNHDEIDLGKLNKGQMKEVFAVMGPDTTMQLYKRGIRRRLAPMLSNNTQKLQLAYSLLFALPGTPVIRYGEEIGMGDDLNLKERLSVRTPMQWDSTYNSGFTVAKNPIRPVISSGEYAYKKVNLASAKSNPSSLLNFVTKMAKLRSQHPEIGEGKWQLLNSGSDEVLAIAFTAKKPLVLVFNFAGKATEASLEIKDYKPGLIHDLYINQSQKFKGKPGNVKINLPAYGFKWMELN